MVWKGNSVMRQRMVYLFTAVNWYRLELFKNLAMMVDLKVYILNGYKVGYDGINYLPNLENLNIQILDEKQSQFNELVKIIDKEEFDTIVVPSMNSIHFIRLTTMLCHYYRQKGKKVLYFWEYWPMEKERSSLSKKVKQSVRHWAVRINKSYIDKFIVPSIYTFSFYRKLGIPASKCVRCFNSSEVEQKHYTRDEVRNLYGIRNEDKVILYFGRLEKYKGIDELVRAFEKLNLENCHLLICGPGKLDTKIASTRIHIAGSIPPNERGKYYAAADLFVLPNTYKNKVEPWGLTVNEAMAFALPILVTDATGSGLDLVFNGVNGFVMDSNNIEEELQKYLRLIMNDDIFRNSLSENSKKIISNYTFSNMAKAFRWA